MYIFFDKVTKRRISYISNRCSKAKNKYLKTYSPRQESKRIIHLDLSNVYDYAKSKFLPRREFKWMNPKEFDMNKYNMVQKDVFLKLILNTLKSCENYTRTIL